MATFSQRYGYKAVSNVIIRECLTEAIQNAMCNEVEQLRRKIIYITNGNGSADPNFVVWTKFLNKKSSEYSLITLCGDHCIENYFSSTSVHWYEKLDLLEFIIKSVCCSRNMEIRRVGEGFVDNINLEFKRLNFAYRIINTQIVEISSEEEIKTIQTAIDQSQDNVKLHLQQSLQLLANRENPDYRNSIKESISAVEAICRELTGESTLGKALSHLKSKGVNISNMLQDSFQKLYAYTNQSDTGIRHALMDEQNAPTADEAILMLVSCSAFVNYLKKKTIGINE